MKPAPHAVDINEWQRAGVSTISEQDKDPLLSWLVPAAGTGEAGMAKAIARKIRAGGGVLCFGQLPAERSGFFQSCRQVLAKQLASGWL